jgi:uncharacterized protein (DUF983 family)
MRIGDFKYCSRCKGTKLRDEFNKNQSWCRCCQSAIWSARKSAREVA